MNNNNKSAVEFAGSTVINGVLVAKFRGMRLEKTFRDKKKYYRNPKHKNGRDW